MVASVVFLTPWGALLGLAGLLPLAALGLAVRRERRIRSVLRLRAPERERTALRLGLVAAVPALLAVAAAQPALRSTTAVKVRTDAEAFYVLDTSRSMLAARAFGAPTRLARARSVALALRAELPGLSSGVAVLTDHVLPDLFPVADASVFERTVRQAVQVGNPPPTTNAVTATSLGTLSELATQSFFSPGVRHRVAIVLTDGESRPFDVAATGRALDRQPGVTLILIRIGSGSEAVFDPGGQPETAYHPDPAAPATVASLAQAARGRAFDGSQVAAAASAVRRVLGSGPTRAEGTTVTTHTLAPWLALAALLPLLLLLGEGVVARLALHRMPGPQPAAAVRAG